MVLNVCERGTYAVGTNRHGGLNKDCVRAIRRFTEEIDVTVSELAIGFDWDDLTICRVIYRDTYDYIG